MDMCVYSYPETMENKEMNDMDAIRALVDTYAEDVEIIPDTGEINIRKAARINEEVPKGYEDAMLSEDDFVKLESMFGFVNHLRNDDSGTGKDNINYISEYKVKDKSRYFDMNRSLRDYFMEERENEEKEYWEMNDELSQEELDKLMDCGSNERHNRFLDDIDSLS